MYTRLEILDVAISLGIFEKDQGMANVDGITLRDMRKLANEIERLVTLRCELLHREQIEELNYAIVKMRQDAERYRLLRCYRLRGTWPTDITSAPVTAFSSAADDPSAYTQSILDKMLDEMLGYYVPPNVREDFKQWRRTDMAEAVMAVSGQVLFPGYEKS